MCCYTIIECSGTFELIDGMVELTACSFVYDVSFSLSLYGINNIPDMDRTNPSIDEDLTLVPLNK